MLRILHGDCREVSSQLEVVVSAVVTDPPYGFEFAQKSDWLIQSGFVTGGSARFQGSVKLPSFGSACSENRVCRKCKGTERGKDRRGFTRCRCESPDFPLRKVVPSDIGKRMQAWHHEWLTVCYQVLCPGGVLMAFSASRMYHRLAAAMEDVGFRDIGLQAWIYGSGYPKSGSMLKPSYEPVVVGYRRE